MTFGRLAIALAITAAGAGGCTTLLGYPDRGPPADESATTADGAAPVDGPVVEPDGAMIVPEAGVDGDANADANDGGCTGTCPVAAYDFEEGTGTTTRDSSGNKNDGMFVGATWGVGKVGGAVSFNGANVGVQFSSSASLDIAGTHITLVFWAFLVDDQTHDHVLLNKPWTNGMMNPPYYQYGVEFNRTAKTYDFFLGTAAAGSNKLSILATPTSTWTHVAFSYDGAMMRGYLNGVMAGQVAATAAIPARGSALRMGVDGVAAQGFSGRLDSVRIYDRTLTVQEIIALRDAK